MTPRVPVGLACVAATLLGGCAVEVPFDLGWTLQVVAPPRPSAVALPMDLSEQGEIWSRRDSVEAVQVESLSLKVVALGSGNRAESMEVALRYRPEGGAEAGDSDVVLMERIVLPLQLDAVVDLSPPATVGSTVLEALRASGRFTLIVETDADGPVDATVDLALAGSAAVTP